ncbi:conserved hypothetical protein [Aeropyrum pernix K1]|uniref:DUF499 domain-containing protein n=1 Tax=Aeropyrum pernix (strain ATCC 700893 / DSM 11879 / JCM 9820 / NBRC 100138 / K1) TaxID=272557 RepID=Q9YF25_AERPE|nr:DUF499 domain-containing protein [Aeropyrum pernix]BAA79371.1 conserved hypothetical protein [Aeropyrum pernix K1]
MVDVRSLRVRDEVKNLRYEPAVDLGDLVKGNAPIFIQDPAEFFSRTHLTDSMKELVIKAFMNLLGLKAETIGGKRYTVSSNLILLPSDLGGGKTHSLILLYHVFKLVRDSHDKESVISKLRILDNDIADFVDGNWDLIKNMSLNLVVIDCKYSDLAPSPVRPIEIGGRRVKTLWGYLGYELGRYDIVKISDERETAPYADDVSKLLNGSRALVLIDEIGRYYDQSGLEPTKISAFLMNLAEALSKYNVSEVAVVISIPYEVRGGGAEAKAGMEYVHRPELIRAINEVLSRPSVEIIKPVGRRDLAEILRKRIFAHKKNELKKFFNELVSREFNREYPAQVRRILDDRSFWREAEETYPFHPMFLNVLEKLAYRLPYLQRTRDAIKIAVQTVLALKEGLFDALEDEINLIMPHHIPLFVSEVLDETILRNAPDEYRVFYLILRSNVVVPENLGNLKKLSKEEFYERVMSRALKSLKEDEAKLGLKLASNIWLHSLVGLGLPMNMGEFPTTADLIYSVSPTEQDAKGVLGILRSVLPQLIVHGDPESDSAKWFFTIIPSVEELIEILKKNVTDEMAKNKLAELLESGLIGRRGRGRPPKGYKEESVFAGYAVVKNAATIPKEILDSRDPALIVFADKISKDELFKVLKGRNNIVVLAPHVEGMGEEEKLAPEDIAGIRELAGLRGKTVWDSLLEILKYYVATESIREENLRAFLGEKVVKGDEEYLKELLNLLKTKVESKKDYYYIHSWNMINRCYRKVYYYRLGQIRFEEGLSLESDKPILPLVEEFLREKELIPYEFKGENIISIVKDYLGKNPKEEPIKVGELWNFILSTDKANVPIIRYRDFIGAVEDLVKSLDYAIRVKGKLLWKPIFKSKEEADALDEGNKLLEKVREHLTRIKASWDDVELVYWEKVFDEWLIRETESIPSDKIIKVKDRSGQVFDIRDIKFDVKNVIKSGKLFYEEKKYLVELNYELPDDILEDKEYEVAGEVIVKNYENEFLVKLQPDEGLSVEPSEFKGKSPLPIKFRLKAGRAGNYRIKVEVYGNGSILDSRIISVSVKGEWIEEEITIGEEGEAVEEDAKLVSIRVNDVVGLPSITRVAKVYPGKIRGSLSVSGKAVSVSFNVDTTDPKVFELLWSPINSILRNMKEASALVDIEYSPEGELELRDVAKLLVSTKGLKFKVKKKASRR